MYKAPSIVLRYGVIAGLIITIVGITLNTLLNMDTTIVMIGLMTIVLTPLTSLFVLSIILILKKDINGFILSQLAIIIILASILLSLYK
ncbi:MAG: hypothetical protein DRO40_01820 [Thermoprotei archaeon]|nr:MAG: hypothetical protein DRO40_01820 [Thermoprotei archaeon]